MSRLDLIRSRLSQVDSSDRNSTPPILQQIISKSKAKSTREKINGVGRESMSLKKINYNDIFQNNVYKYSISPEKLPPVKKKERKIMPEMKRTEINKSALAFPNSSLSLDINTEFDLKSNNLKYIFLVKNVKKEKHKDFENKLTDHISKEVRKMALRQIIEERRLKNSTPSSKNDIKYKPYSLKDYKHNFAQDIQKPLGGMGPNVGTLEWNSKAARREKMINFAKEAESSNKIKLLNLKPASINKIKKRRFGVDGPIWEMM